MAKKKKTKLRKVRNILAVIAWFRNSAGAMKSKKYSRISSLPLLPKYLDAKTYMSKRQGLAGPL